MAPKQVLDPAIRLERSEESKAVRHLYRRDISSHVGQKGTRLFFYLPSSELMSPVPDFIDVMIFLNACPDLRPHTRVFTLELIETKGAAGYKYLKRAVSDPRARGEEVFIPRPIFTGEPPALCWLELTMPNGR